MECRFGANAIGRTIDTETPGVVQGICRGVRIRKTSQQASATVHNLAICRTKTEDFGLKKTEDVDNKFEVYYKPHHMDAIQEK